MFLYPQGGPEVDRYRLNPLREPGSFPARSSSTRPPSLLVNDGPEANRYLGSIPKPGWFTSAGMVLAVAAIRPSARLTSRAGDYRLSLN